jgi:hypothetical protein
MSRQQELPGNRLLFFAFANEDVKKKAAYFYAASTIFYPMNMS